MKKNDNFYLLHIRDSIELIRKYTSTISKKDFLNDTLIQDGVIRQLEIIGEASTKISEKTRTEMTNVPWKDVIGMRNILIHQYFGVDLDSVWYTVKNDLSAMHFEVSNFIDNSS